MAIEVARAEQFYAEGAELIDWLEPSGRRIFGLMMATYRSLLREIAWRPADVFRRHVRVSGSRSCGFSPVGRCCRRGKERNRCDEMESEAPRPVPPPLAIIGGGLSGLAAAVAAVEQGFRVELFEQAKSLGGRAGSLVDSETGQRIDYCPHVAMGCCTRFLDFCRRTRIDDCFERSALRLHLIGPEGTRHDFAASRWLPAPLHLLPGLLKLRYLSLAERWGIIKAIGNLRERRQSSRPSNAPTTQSAGAGEETIGAWLRRHGQSERAIERFWSVILVSALGETLDHASLAAARKVFCDGFLASPTASDLVLPRLPLGAIFHDRVGRWLADQGVTVHLDTPVRQIEGDRRRASAMILADGTRREFDGLIVAVPWRNVKSLFADDLLAAMPALADVERIEPAAITAVHLWFDRPITRLPHAVLVGRLSQWVFADTLWCRRPACDSAMQARRLRHNSIAKS